MRKHREKDIYEEPFIPWIRKRYKGSKPDNDPELLAEIETDRDLDKPIEQLLCDVQDSLQNWLKPREKPEDIERAISLILYSLGRTASMNARVAISNSKLANQMRWLTYAIGAMTLFMLILSIFNYCKLQ